MKLPCRHPAVAVRWSGTEARCDICGVVVRLASEPPPKAREHLFDVLTRDGQLPKSQE